MCRDIYYLKDSRDDFVTHLTRNEITTNWEFNEGRNAFPSIQAACDYVNELGWGNECRVVVFCGYDATEHFKDLGSCRQLDPA